MPATLPPALRLALHAARSGATLPTGHPALDAALAGGGWPRGALGELLLPATGSGELPLLLPALAARVRAGGWLLLVDPPGQPCLPAWQAAGITPGRLVTLHPRDARQWSWATEQAARTGGCCVLAWQGRHPLAMRELRRLQLAAQEGDALCLLLRPAAQRAQASPAALRLLLQAEDRGQVQVTIVKQRGGGAGTAVTLALHAAGTLPRLAAWQLPVHGAPDDRTGSTAVAGTHGSNGTTHAGTREAGHAHAIPHAPANPWSH